LKIFRWIFDVLPTPFWVYAVSIGAGASGLLPNDLPLYDQTVRHVLPLAICTMLLGVPIRDVMRMGRPALLALSLASGTVFIAQIVSYLLLIRWLPDDAWKSVGALLGTWIGGSANMIAVKEILQLSGDSLTPLIIVDTILSYTWMAILLAAVRFQSSFPNVSIGDAAPNMPANRVDSRLQISGMTNLAMALLIAIGVAELSIFIGVRLNTALPQLSSSAWALLVVSLISVLLSPWVAALFKAREIRKLGAWLLYAVLFAIGVRTNVHGSTGSIFLLYGVLAFALHGLMLWFSGQRLRLPLALLATASQANIGGAASAPIVAEAYQPGIGYLGVLMAVAGAVMGTYIGVLGAGLCRFLGSHLLGRPL
jgi:uncharacterized membrane protein